MARKRTQAATPTAAVKPTLPDPLALLAELAQLLRQLCNRLAESDDAALLKLLPPMLAQLRGLINDHARLEAGKLPALASVDAVFAAFSLADLAEADLIHARTRLEAAQSSPLPPPTATPG